MANRVRPETIDDFVGQKQLLGEGKILREIIEQDQISSMIFGDRQVLEKRRWRKLLRVKQKQILFE
ncbi:hypothetical protein GCM10025857_48430 [Alicyclobacillus contaminans]|nr:hypothetical protein GCM10025857_48430 [Alicyclobacillus contaminans]